MPTGSRKRRFGDFEADLETGELRKFGIPIKIQDQPMRVLAALLERRGELVTREEFQQRLWPDVQALDFEHGLNMAVRKLRTALNDSADTPRFIETLPKKGYRFIAPVVAGEQSPAPLPAPLPLRLARHRATLAIVAVLLLAGLAASWRPKPEGPMKLSVSYSGSGAITQLSFAPDGSTLAFTASSPGEGTRIFLKSPGIGLPRRLTEDTETTHTESEVAWIPDGSGISYVRKQKEGLESLYAVSPAGGASRKLIDLGDAGGYSWAPNAKSLAVSLSRDKSQYAIFSLRPSDGTLQQLSHPPPENPSAGTPLGGDISPQFSPDGSKIAFARGLASTMVILVMPAEGGPPIELARHRGRIRSIAWSANGEEILYSTRARPSLPSMYRVALRDASPSAVPSVSIGVDIPALAVSPKDGRLAYVVASVRSGIWHYGLTPSSPPARVAESDGFQSSPSFAPDGKRFAFSSNRSGNSEIYVSGIDGKQPMQLTSIANGASGWPRWSPDGRSIVFDSRIEGKPGIYVIDAEGGAPRLVSEGAGDAMMPEWSPDGRSIYYTRSAPGGKTDIWRIRASGGHATRITSDEGYGALPSPDGSVLYVGRRSEATLRAIPVSGGPAIQTVPGPRPHYMVAARSGIYFVEQTPVPGPQRLLHFDFVTKKTTQKLSLQGPPVPPALAISRDETAALFAQLDDFLSRIMIVESLR